MNGTSPTPPSTRPLLIGKAAILSGLTVYFTYTILSGNLNNYINSRFAWLTYAAVVLFAGLAVSALMALRGGARIAHTPVRLPALLMLAVPLALALVPSRPLGAEAVDSGLQIGAASYGLDSVALVAKDPLARDVLDWSRLFMTEESPTVFNGQSARVLGFVYREPTFPDGTFMIGRFTVSCCVADALALGLPARYAGETALQDGQWVEVAGTFRAEAFMGDQVPVLQVAELTPTAEPDHPYLYP